MPNELNIEQQIRQAMERGDFDDLKGKGQPLNLDAYFSTPEDMRMAHSILKSNDYVPEEVELLNEVARLREQIKQTQDEIERAELTRLLQKKHLTLTIALEKHRRKS